jgi:hypothetical protein
VSLEFSNIASVTVALAAPEPIAANTTTDNSDLRIFFSPK